MLSIKTGSNVKVLTSDGFPIAIVESDDKKIEGVVRLNEQLTTGKELIELPADGDLKFQVMPEMRENLRSVIYVVGKSGSGKSYWCGEYMRIFQLLFKCPAKNMVLISADDFSDPAYKSVNYTHIKADDDMVENPLDLDELTRKDKSGKPLPSLILFDDFEGIHNKKVKQAVEALQQRVLEIGRKRLIYVLYVAHISASGQASRLIANELTGFVFFPKSGAGSNLGYFLTNHLNVPEQLRTCFKSDSGWGRSIYIQNTSPQYIISPYRCCMFDVDEVNSALKKRNLIDKIRAKQDAEKFVGGLKFKGKEVNGGCTSIKKCNNIVKKKNKIHYIEESASDNSETEEDY
jgi:hypothetical protein